MALAALTCGLNTSTNVKRQNHERYGRSATDKDSTSVH